MGADAKPFCLSACVSAFHECQCMCEAAKRKQYSARGEIRIIAGVVLEEIEAAGERRGIKKKWPGVTDCLQ